MSREKIIQLALDNLATGMDPKSVLETVYGAGEIQGIENSTERIKELLKKVNGGV